MFNLKDIKGIIFDYGGTIDSNGKHWAEVLWDAYQDVGVPITKEVFREAYVYTERYLATNPLVQPEDTFKELLKIKTDLQINYLIANKFLELSNKSEEYSLAISNQCYTFASNVISKEIPIIKALYEKYPMVLVSNFYGNVQSVLKDFDLLSYFNAIVESSVVGVRKPDPAIFALGVEQLGIPSSDIVVIGDSYSKDIVPARKNGCKTIWLQGPGWGDDEEGATADVVISDFMEIANIFNLNE